MTVCEWQKCIWTMSQSHPPLIKKNPAQKMCGYEKQKDCYALAAGFFAAMSRMPATILDGTGSKRNGSIE